MMNIETQNKFELGPIQKEWVRRLREHPERQTMGQLGYKRSDLDVPYRACCLGEGSILLCELNKKDLQWDKIDETESLYDLISNGCRDSLSDEDYTALGLRDKIGSFAKSYEYPDTYNIYGSLAEMNDEGMTWIQIANYIEANPENVFVKSV
jgi:hypothetical protein